ncbi:MAG: flagellin [Gemmatimonadota bacterium]|nr:flagellin [Gemmatimonadota bacterium]
MSRINTNAAANTAYKNLSASGMVLDKQIAKLSSGFRINRAGDDAAGLSIANKLRSEGRALRMASQNATQAGSVLNIADGAVNVLSTVLDRMKELATQAASANLSTTDRSKVQAEHASLLVEVDRIVNSTQYQGATLLGGGYGTQVSSSTGALISGGSIGGSAGATASSIVLNNAKASTTYTLALASGATTGSIASATLTDQSGNSQTVQYISTTAATAGIGGAPGSQTLNFSALGVTISSTFIDGSAAGGTGGTIVSTAAAAASFQVGTDASSNSQIGLSLGNVTAAGLGISTTALSTSASALTSLTTINTAIDTLNTTIGTIGAAQNRLEFAQANLTSIIQNVVAAESVIRDADMAFEMTVFTKTQILQQAGTAMLAQANQLPQGILTLLRG